MNGRHPTQTVGRQEYSREGGCVTVAHDAGAALPNGSALMLAEGSIAKRIRQK